MTALDKRKECIQRRSSLTNSKRIEKEKAITNCVLPFLKGKIGTYIPIRNEVDVYTMFRDKFDLYIPKMLDDTTIAFYSDHEEKSKGPFSTIEPIGIQEVKDLDVILVPVVGFFGTYRMGYGKGYYDRYLSHSSALKIGVAFDVQEMHFDVKSTDVMLDMIITESRILK